ncbi:MAG: hypothetical protein ACKO2C_04870 [Actinomycetes bacterium]
MRRTSALLGLGLAAALLVPAGIAGAATPRRTVLPPLVAQTIHYEAGPFHLNPGQNTINNAYLPNDGSGTLRPTVPGWIVGIRPNLILTDGTIPPVDLIHLHHAVWLNMSRPDWTAPDIPERFFATGEEKTNLTIPRPFGYWYDPGDTWLLNHMLHVLDENAYDVKVTYDFDFIPYTVSGARIKPAVPIWMDVRNGSSYPVFDAIAGTGTEGKWTYPTDVADPYPDGNIRNRYTIPVRGALIATAGHLHPGGLWTDLSLTRTMPLSGAVKRARLFRSAANYYEPAGPVSWDVSMGATPSTWRVGVRPGDVLDVTTTYDTNGWSWYEGMGIMVTWFAPNRGGRSPFSKLHPVDVPGVLTHGHLPENDNHGGGFDPDLPDPSTLTEMTPPTVGGVPTIDIVDFEYTPGDLDLATHIPAVPQGTALRFRNLDVPIGYGYGIWHSITTCKLPCNKSTGIAYPVADGPVILDSGQLGNYGPPTSGQRNWSTPSNLAAGTYAYFCRVHPLMRGAFKITSN